MQTPIIHMNGTSREELVRQIEEVLEALHDTREKIAAAAPNARDYYLGGRDFSKATEEHIARMHTLERLCSDYVTLMESVVNTFPLKG